MATGTSQKQEGGYSRSTKRQKESPLCFIDGHLVTSSRVVLRGDIVKDDSGACTVFTEQGSSASQMTAAEVMDVIARFPDCDGQTADAVSISLFTSNIGGRSQIAQNSKVRMSRRVDTSSTTQMAEHG